MSRRRCQINIATLGYTPESSTNLVTLPQVSMGEKGSREDTYALSGLEMNLFAMKRHGQLQDALLRWRGMSGVAAASKTRREVCEGWKGLTISRILTRDAV